MQKRFPYLELGERQLPTLLEVSEVERVSGLDVHQLEERPVHELLGQEVLIVKKLADGPVQTRDPKRPIKLGQVNSPRVDFAQPGKRLRRREQW